LGFGRLLCALLVDFLTAENAEGAEKYSREKAQKAQTFFRPRRTRRKTTNYELKTKNYFLTGISEIVHAPNLKNKIGAGSALILSLRNSGENPKRKRNNHLK